MPAVMPWAKYLQLRVLSHYGVEAVCALNDVRVYGKSAIEDFEDSLVKQARGAEAASTFGHISSVGTAPAGGTASVLTPGPAPPSGASAPEVPTKAPAPSAPEDVPPSVNATAGASAPDGGPMGTEVPPSTVNLTAAVGDRPVSASTEPSKEPERAIPGEPERQDTGVPTTGGSVQEPREGGPVSQGGEPKDTGAEGGKVPKAPPLGTGTVPLPEEGPSSPLGNGNGNGNKKEEGASGTVHAEPQTGGAPGEGGPAGDQPGTPAATDLAPLSLEDWPSNTLVNGRQTTIFDMLVQVCFVAFLLQLRVLCCGLSGAGVCCLLWLLSCRCGLCCLVKCCGFPGVQVYVVAFSGADVCCGCFGA
jgi:Sad1 / UNC-like C-terminal